MGVGTEVHQVATHDKGRIEVQCPGSVDGQGGGGGLAVGARDADRRYTSGQHLEQRGPRPDRNADLLRRPDLGIAPRHRRGSNDQVARSHPFRTAAPPGLDPEPA